MSAFIHENEIFLKVGLFLEKYESDLSFINTFEELKRSHIRPIEQFIQCLLLLEELNYARLYHENYNGSDNLSLEAYSLTDNDIIEPIQAIKYLHSIHYQMSDYYELPEEFNALVASIQSLFNLDPESASYQQIYESCDWA